MGAGCVHLSASAHVCVCTCTCKPGDNHRSHPLVMCVRQGLNMSSRLGRVASKPGDLPVSTPVLTLQAAPPPLAPCMSSGNKTVSLSPLPSYLLAKAQLRALTWAIFPEHLRTHRWLVHTSSTVGTRPTSRASSSRMVGHRHTGDASWHPKQRYI